MTTNYHDIPSERIARRLFCSQMQAELPALVFGTDGLELRSMRSALRPLLLSLRVRYKFNLIDMAIIDHPKCLGRFGVYYVLFSPILNLRVIVTIRVAEAAAVPSVVSLFPSAGWLEREAWDMFGVFFWGNPAMRRILTDYGFVGHPLRKDYPLAGYDEAVFNDAMARVLAAWPELNQALRLYSSETKKKK